MIETSLLNLNDRQLDEKLEVEAMKIKNETEREKFRSWVEKFLQTDEDKKNYLSYKCFQDEIQARNFEVDMLLGLKDYQAIIDIEVKSTTDDKSVKNVLKKAAGQLRKVNKTFEGCHRDILGKEWKFVRVIAMPNIDKRTLDKDTCCNYCSSFVINTAEIDNFRLWIENLLSVLQYNANTNDAYRKLFTRIIGFYSCSENHSVSVTLSMRDARIEYEKAITGQEKGVSSEETLLGEPLPKNLDNLNMKDLKMSKNDGGNKPLSSAAVMIYWNPSQLSLLLEKEETKKRILFIADFGCGKTLLMKNFASIVARNKRGNCYQSKVFFVSLAAAKGQELENKSEENNTLIQSYRHPAVIDVANKIDFQGKDVQVHFHLLFNGHQCPVH